MRHRLTMLVALGYFVVWALLGVVAFVVSQGLGAADMRWGPGPGRLSFVTALVLLVAGSVQLSSWKARQLLRCRDESGCGGRRRSDALGAWRHGLTFGMRCALCCSGLMLALLAVGLMHMVAMALATLAITAERLAPGPERVARVAGVAMVTAGALALARI